MNNLNKKDALQAAQLEQLLATNTRTLLASIGMAAILAYMQRDVISQQHLLIWLVASIAVYTIRIVFNQYFLHRPTKDPAIVESRLIQFRVGVVLSSLIWGSACLFMFTPDLPKNQMFLIYMLTGLSAGAVVSYSVDIISAISYTVLSLFPMLLRLFWSGDEVSVAMSVAGFLYSGYMVVSIRTFNKNMLENIMLRFHAVKREEEIKKLAFYDVLTNLPNRRLLMDRLAHALAMSARTNKRGALLFIDLDHFKVLNDTLGHDMGDLLLKQVADRLLGCVRESDTVARFGGDEFVIMLEDLSSDHQEATNQVHTVNKQIIASLNEPYQLNSFEYSSTPSIGVALFMEHGQSHDEILKHADIAMYQAKKAGRNVVRMFDYKMREEMESST